MQKVSSLVDYLVTAAEERPRHIAVEESNGGAATYQGLNHLSNRVRDLLYALGVRRGDRVGVYMRKSIDAYAIMLGAMKAGAAYVPLDYAMPPVRAAFMTHDCGMKVLFGSTPLIKAWKIEAEKLADLPEAVELHQVGAGIGLKQALDRVELSHTVTTVENVALEADDLAYILYTSGSTGSPKGVALTHKCAMSHIDWCTGILRPTADDRFSSHSPFHFDMSVTDLYVPLKHAATVVLIDAEQGKDPVGLARMIAERRLSHWHSTPTALVMMLEFGNLQQYDYSQLRYVAFAGEVFPIKHLRRLRALLPSPQFLNFYGPTETNACTWYPIPATIEEDRNQPYPIGRVCSQFQFRVTDEQGRDVARGAQGELLIRGAGVMKGYWNAPERTQAAFRFDAEGQPWYRTGDAVIEEDDGVLVYLGRLDRMVKRRGYRIELAEIETALYRHNEIKEAAVVALENPQYGVTIKAYLVAQAHDCSEVKMRQFCAENLPDYMMPDTFTFIESIPKTSTAKIDYQRMARL